ncbi:NAD(P)H-binding protein [Fructobacillus sp. M2-14]|uniref:NAD(P)H-binding protein n=1 Tax=Fructobacillus broussonetiae TaxID=2713173 RepID=A0ABS5R0Z3_9LACO|nr:NAD(P)H-binding protein [Fructobacillus broussonetiae]MBS9338189.1 NAD(P)H-binding protein [Fructobacillus broussonetiae]
MKVLIIGATGMAGSELVQEALKQNLEVVANGRNVEKLNQLKDQYPSVELLVKDAFYLNHEDFKGIDVIIDAFSCEPKKAYLQVDLSTRLISLLRASQTRIGFILGAGSLYTDEKKQQLVYDLIKSDDSTKPWRATPENQLYELEFLRNVKNVNWYGVSPGESFVPGAQSSNILYGTDIRLKNDQNVSETTSGTMAYAVIQEAIKNQHNQERFTVVNG